MSEAPLSNRLDRPVDDLYDHTLGPADAKITLVEYGSYACAHCRAANARIAAVRNQLGDRLRYVFRHRPLTGSDIARRAAELAERTKDSASFWKAHITLMTRSNNLTEDDLDAVVREHAIQRPINGDAEDSVKRARARVDADVASANASGVLITPTFFINGRRYDGPWDESSLSDALLGRLGHRLRSAALDFANWGPSAGILLLLATILALVLTNSSLGHDFAALWERNFSLASEETGFEMSLLHWINDALLTVFFLVVGLEIKREFTVGHLASPRSAALPVAAAIGGMAVPALIYWLMISSEPWLRGWGVPMATDTAFAVALIVMMGRRVPVALRIFLTAAAIVDDIGAIAVVAVFYSGKLQLDYLAVAVVLIAGLAVLNRCRIYSVWPYMLLGIALWTCVHESGLHATLTGVILALFVPTRPPANLKELMVQADALITAETRHGAEVPGRRPSVPVLEALDAIHDRVESPADRMLRYMGARSSYFVLPLFAFANAGVELSPAVLHGHGALIAAIMAGLVIGKPLGLISASALAVWLGVAVKPNEYSWRQLAGAGALAGIGFTMSLFIAGQAFLTESDFAAVKIGVFAASILSAAIGVIVLWGAERGTEVVRNGAIDPLEYTPSALMELAP
jgi:Na+:H+ antiporter, NhaA family